jgi:hypothetical protein
VSFPGSSDGFDHGLMIVGGVLAPAWSRTRWASRTELSHAAIEQLIGSFENVRETIRQADPASKGTVYRELRLMLTLRPRRKQDPRYG